MAKAGSVAPKERINIKYVPATSGQQEEIELPFKMLVLGDFKGRPDDTVLEKREGVSVDKNTFESVMRESNLEVQLNVRNRLIDENQPQQDIPVKLAFKSMADFSPDNIAKQVPELKKLIELRETLVALKGPLGNVPAFRTKLQTLLSDERSREKLLSELQLITDEDDK